MKNLMINRVACAGLILLIGMGSIAEIEPTWESLAEHYQVPDWFVDGKLGVWFHWGIPSSIKDGRPHDGSHYGAWMYGTEGQLSASKHPEAVQKLMDWHDTTYGPHAEFGYRFNPAQRRGRRRELG